jgi:hypothetical protein
LDAFFIEVRVSGSGLSQAFPQQLPGPAQLPVPGAAPQQVVSPGPGTWCRLLPEIAAWAENIFLMLPPPQWAQQTLSADPETITSKVFPQSRHSYS